MRARRVKGLDPAGPLADNAERIVRVRLDELCAFMPRARDPAEVVALHDMRIAAKRLRYVLEITHACFGPFARTAIRTVKDLQEVLGEVHDCDVQLPDVAALVDALVAQDAAAVLARAPDDASDLDLAAVATAPHAEDYAGLLALAVHLRARRALLFARFLALWEDAERRGFRARLEYALGERPTPRPAEAEIEVE
jgi:hypothetical protein